MKHAVIAATIFLTATLIGGSAYAEEFSYNYLDIGYHQMDVDGVSDTGTGFGLGVSFDVAPNVNLVGGFSNISFDAGDIDGWSAGVGYHTPIDDSVDFTGSLEAVSVSNGSSESGWGASAGLRFAAAEQVELEVGMVYVDIGGETDTGFGFGGVYKFNEQMGLGISYQTSDDSNTLSLGGRIFF